MRSPQLKSIGYLLILVLISILAGCAGNTQSPLAPKSGNAREIADLFYFVFYIAVGIFIIVETLLVFFVIRYRRGKNAQMPPQFHGNTRIEILWTIAPALILAVVFIMTARTLIASNITAQPPAAVKVTAVGHQWWWEFRYPDLGIVTANDLHIPANQVVDVTLESDNVIHSFWVPELTGKTDVVPGHQNRTWLRADRPGTFSGQCAEFCGAQHAHMLFKVIADEPSAFELWAVAQKQQAASPSGGDAARGLQILTGSGGCFACHTVDGVDKAKGKVGPNLTHFVSRTSIAAGTLPNTPENLTRWLQNPQAVKPGNLMVIARQSDADIQALVAYLETLK